MNNRHTITTLQVPAEAAIDKAMQEIEKMGADPRLTDAVVLLQQAKEKVARFANEQIAALNNKSAVHSGA